MKRRILSLLLTVCMLLQLISIGAFAAGESGGAADQSDNGTITRDTVLLLDNSGSMSGTPIIYLKQAAIKFCESVLKAGGTNRVAIVVYDSAVRTSTEFYTDLNQLSDVINGMNGRGGTTNITSAVVKADSMLATSTAGIKNMVVMTDGVVNEGSVSATGPYSSSDNGNYRYANALYSTAVALHDKYSIYSLGFFHNLNTTAKQFAARVLRDIQNAGYYEVTDVENLEFIFGEVASDITNDPGKFKYAGHINQDYDTESEYYYNDSYFYGSACDYDASLSTMSLCLELSTWSSYEKSSWYDPKAQRTDNAEDPFWNDKLINVKTLLLGSPTGESGYEGIGFDHFKANEYWENVPTKDSIGVVAARKQITDNKNNKYTLIALVVRGGGYGSEWASNFTIGINGEHEGFGMAKKEVLDFLQEYVSGIGADESQNLKLWIVGFSRAAATANMVAGDLVKNKTISNLTQENIYCYTFETPMGVLEDQAVGNYSNIHNTINFNDLVPLVAMEAWDFTRYNKRKDNVLPSAIVESGYTAAGNAMLNEYEKMGFERSSYKIIDSYTATNLKIDYSKILPFGDPFISTYQTTESFHYSIQDTVDYLAENLLINRVFYEATLEESVRDLTGILFHYDGVGAGLVTNFVDDLIARFQLLTEIGNLGYVLAPLVSMNPFYSQEDRLADVEARIMEVLDLDSLLEELGTQIKNATQLKGLEVALKCIVKRAANDFGTTLAKTTVGDTNDFNTLAQSIFTTGYLFAIGNQPHFPEICLAWVRSQDPNYNPDANTISSGTKSGITRVIYINCPVDVQVYDSDGNLVASIADDQPVPVEGSSIISSVSANDEKIVYLPGNGEYHIEMKATGDGEVSYSVNEHNFVCGMKTRILNYYDIPVQVGDVLTAEIPKISDKELQDNDTNGSTVKYILRNADGSEISADNEYQGGEIESIYYEVTLTKEGNGGYISGAGTYLEGHFAKLEAQTLPSSQFYGWYDGDTLVSKDSVYRFAVTSDMNLTAKFDEVEVHKMSLRSSPGGKVTSVEGYYSEGMQIAVVAEADEGYEFAGWRSFAGGTFEDSKDAETFFTMPDNDVFVVAQFVKSGDSNENGGVSNNNSGNTQYYSVTINDTENGVVSASRETAAKGTTVFLTAVPDPGYVLERITVTTSSGQTIKIAEENGKYSFSMPSCKVSVSATFVKEAAAQTFVDVFPEDWFYKEVMYVVDKKLMNGVGDNRFAPSGGTSRAMIVTILHRLEGAPDAASTAFSDVPNDQWYSAAVNWAAANGIVTGYGNGKFGPDDAVTREQMATLFWRYAQYKKLDVSVGETTNIRSYADAEQVSDYAVPAMQWACGAGVIQGKDNAGNRHLAPADTTTRAQMATMMMRFCTEILK